MEYKRLTERRGGLVIDKCGNCENVSNPQGCTDKKCYEIMKNRLADLEDKIEQGTLKEEKTCKNVSEMHPVDGFTCSECGISLEAYSEKEVDEENGDITYREYMLRYCPNCGAKVVEE